MSTIQTIRCDVCKERTTTDDNLKGWFLFSKAKNKCSMVIHKRAKVLTAAKSPLHDTPEDVCGMACLSKRIQMVVEGWNVRSYVPISDEYGDDDNSDGRI